MRSVCADGAAGLTAALNEHYDLLLLDLMLPEEVDGFTICRAVREKIEDDPAHPKLLQTVWGVGYRLSRGE